MKYKLPPNWTEKPLGEVVELHYGKPLPIKQRIHGNIPVYTSAGLTSFHNTPLVQTEGVIIGRKGSIGTVYFSKGPFYCIDTAFYILPKAEYDLKYIFYKLKQMQLNKLNEDSAIPGLNKNTICTQKIYLPPLAEQKRIATILSYLDEKIELNQKTNGNLQQIAQTLFKHWFIDFEFPCQNDTSYKNNKDKLLPSELGPIPSNWQIDTIENISQTIVCGKTPPTKIDAYFGQDIPFITITDMHNKIFITKTNRYLSSQGATLHTNRLLPPKSICVSCIATPGLVTITTQTCQTNQQINTIICKQEHSYLYIYFRLLALKDEIQMKGSYGSTTNNLNKKQFSKMKIIVADSKTQFLFEQTIEPLFEKILHNELQNNKLATIRDTLLEKLVNGEINIATK